MRKLITLMHISLDGFVAGPTGEMNWITMDDEIFTDAIELAAKTDTAVYGRNTYQMMEGYWPTVLENPASTELELHHARWVQDIDKIVFSNTLETADWNNTRLIKSNSAEALRALKQQDGGSMMIFGSPRLVHYCMQHDLIDEYRINLNPAILGRGIPFFQNIMRNSRLELLTVRHFRSGVVGLHYATRNN